MVIVGRVAQLGEHLLCKHAVISPKSLNRRLLTVQTPLLVGLLIGLQLIRIRCPSLDKDSEKWTRFEFSEHNPKNDLGLLSAIALWGPYSDNKAARTLERVSGPFQHHKLS